MRNLKLFLAVAGAVLVGGAVLAATWVGDDREQAVTLDQLPAEVMVALLREAGAGEILEIVRDVEGDRIVFEAEIRQGDRVMEIEFAADGTILEREEEGDDDEEDEGDDDDEGDDEDGAEAVGIPARDLPAGARRAIAEQIGHEDFVAWTERVHGTTVYEARWEVDGREIEVEVTADGVLLEIEEIMPVEAVPAGVLRQVEQQLPNATEVNFVQITVFAYEVEAIVDGRPRELLILPSGRLAPDD